MRSVVGTAMDDDFGAPAPRHRARSSRAKGPKINRGGKRGRERAPSARFAASFKATARRMMFWGAMMAVFFGIVAAMGLVSGGHVSAALRSANASFDAAMSDLFKRK